MGGVGFDVNTWLSLVGGDRALGVDFQDGDFVFDVVQHGPIFGGVIRF